MESEGLKVEDVIEIWRVRAEGGRCNRHMEEGEGAEGGGGCNRHMESEGLKVEDVIEIWRCNRDMESMESEGLKVEDVIERRVRG